MLYVCNKEETQKGKNITSQKGKIDQYSYFFLRVESKKKASFNSQACKTDLCKLCPEQYISYLSKVTQETSGRLSSKAHFCIRCYLVPWRALENFVSLFCMFCQLSSRERNGVGWLYWKCFLERAVLQMSIVGQKTTLDPPTHLKNGQILNRFQIGKDPEANKMCLCWEEEMKWGRFYLNVLSFGCSAL